MVLPDMVYDYGFWSGLNHYILLPLANMYVCIIIISQIN